MPKEKILPTLFLWQQRRNCDVEVKIPFQPRLQLHVYIHPLRSRLSLVRYANSSGPRAHGASKIGCWVAGSTKVPKLILLHRWHSASYKPLH